MIEADYCMKTIILCRPLLDAYDCTHALALQTPTALIRYSSSISTTKVSLPSGFFTCSMCVELSMQKKPPLYGG